MFNKMADYTRIEMISTWNRLSSSQEDTCSAVTEGLLGKLVEQQYR